MPAPIAAVFVSSTWLDLQPERAAVEKALNRFHEAKFIGMEYFGSRDETTRGASLDEVERSQLYIGIFAGRYGSGITEAEYRRARERRLDCLIYFKADGVIAAEMRETEAPHAQRLAALKEDLRRHTVTTFSTAEELAAGVTADVHRWLFDKFLKERLKQENLGEIACLKTGESSSANAEAYRLQNGSSLGSVLDTAAAPLPQRRATPLLPNVRRFRGLINRTAEVQAALETLPTALPVEVHGPAGAGKTVLLRTIAYHPDLSGNPDGVVYHDRVGAQPIADLEQCLYDSFYHSTPRLRPREGELRQLLREPQALILLDDVEQATQELESLFNLLPNCLFCIASEERRLYGEVKTIALAGLPEEDALALIEREHGAPLTAQERAAARQIWEFAQGSPSQMILAVASARQQNMSLAELAATGEASQPSGQSLRRNLESRNASERRVLAVLGALGTFISKEALAACLPTAPIESLLQALLDAKLIQSEGVAYSLSGGAVKALQDITDLNATWLEALPYLARWAEQHRAESELLLRDFLVLQRAAEWAANQAHWPQVLRLVRAIEPALSNSGLWTAWQRLLDLAARAAEETHDNASRAWALHQLGSRAICLDEREPANIHLQQALALRIELGDHWGAALTRHNLDLLQPPISLGQDGPRETQPESPNRNGENSWRLANLPRAVKLACLGLIAVAGGLAAQKFWPWPWPRPVIPFQLSFSPTRLEFASPALNQPSAIHTVNVTNTGKEPLTIGSAGLSGAGSSDFVLTENTCEDKLLPGDTGCHVRLRFTPTGAEPSMARLIFRESGGKQTAEVELRGEVESAPKPPTASILAVRPARVEFGEIEIGSQARAEITVTNAGNAPLRLTQSVVSGSQAGDFRLAQNRCQEADLPPRANCVIDLDFTPSAAGTRDAALVLSTHDGAREQVVLRGAGIAQPAGEIRTEPAEAEFGEVELRKSAQQPIHLVHSVGAPVEIRNTTLLGAQAKDFAIVADGCQGITLAGGQRCRLIVSFTPSEPGRRESILSVANNTREREHRVRLFGVGRAPLPARLEIDPASLDFGQQMLNAPPSSQRLSVRNGGSADVRIARVGIVGSDARHFSVTSNSCGAALAREASCRMTLGYHPSAAAMHSAVLRIEFEGGQQEIALRGRAIVGQTPTAGFNPTQINFGEQVLRSSGSRDVIVQNRGSGELAVTRAQISGSNSFAVANRCTVPLREQVRCTLRVTFSPNAQGQQSAVLLVSHNASNSPQQISLSGVGTLPATPNIDVNPARLQFGSQTAGTTSAAQTVTITNTGSAPLAIHATAIEGNQAGDFTMSGNCANRTIAPRGRCQLSLRFAPKSQQAARAALTTPRSAALAIRHNAPGSPKRITVDGTAVIKPAGPAFPGGLTVDPDIRVIDSGWCCTSGNVQKSTPAQCAARKGSFFADQQSAQSRCVQIIR